MSRMKQKSEKFNSEPNGMIRIFPKFGINLKYFGEYLIHPKEESKSFGWQLELE